MKRPTRVLCKRTCISGEDHWWESEGSAEPPEFPKRHPRENRMHVKGEWYDVVFNENDKWGRVHKTFTILDKMGNKHLFFMYTDKDKKKFPKYCDLYGTRDYEKWFYTPEEVEMIEAGTYTESYKVANDICVLVGNYHWVKESGEWIIAQATAKHKTHGKHYWKTFGHTGADKTDDDFEDIGHQVDSMKTQQKNKEEIKRLNELNEAIFPMLDSWFAEGTEDAQWRAPLEYHKQFVKEATERNSKKMWESIADSAFFGKDKLKKW